MVISDKSPGINPHIDTPVEILHTILLGVVKYFWGQSVHIMEKAHKMQTFLVRLSSVNKNGLNAPSLNAEYICQYKGGLIGKHFKSIAQVMPFVAHGLLLLEVINAWTCLGSLIVLLWHTHIEDLDVYLTQLRETIDEFLVITAQCVPSIMILKPKFHFLVHLPMHIRRFGPSILYSTERYESFNHIFHLGSIYI